VRTGFTCNHSACSGVHTSQEMKTLICVHCFCTSLSLFVIAGRTRVLLTLPRSAEPGCAVRDWRGRQ
jgi:hypothetical protein